MARLDSQGCGVIIIISIFTIVIIVIIIISVLFLLLVNFIIMLYNYYRVLQKKQPSTWNHGDTLLTPATPNFNVVIGSAEHHQQKWLFFLKAAKHKIQ